MKDERWKMPRMAGGSCGLRQGKWDLNWLLHSFNSIVRTKREKTCSRAHRQWACICLIESQQTHEQPCDATTYEAHCSLFTVHCSLFNVQCTMHPWYMGTIVRLCHCIRIRSNPYLVQAIEERHSENWNFIPSHSWVTLCICELLHPSSRHRRRHFPSQWVTKDEKKAKSKAVQVCFCHTQHDTRRESGKLPWSGKLDSRINFSIKY